LQWPWTDQARRSWRCPPAVLSPAGRSLGASGKAALLPGRPTLPAPLRTSTCRSQKAQSMPRGRPVPRGAQPRHHLVPAPRAVGQAVHEDEVLVTAALHRCRSSSRRLDCRLVLANTNTAAPSARPCAGEPVGDATTGGGAAAVSLCLTGPVWLYKQSGNGSNYLRPIRKSEKSIYAKSILIFPQE